MEGDPRFKEILSTFQMDIILKTHFLILKIVLKTPATCLWPLDLHGCLTEIIVETVELT